MGFIPNNKSSILWPIGFFVIMITIIIGGMELTWPRQTDIVFKYDITHATCTDIQFVGVNSFFGDIQKQCKFSDGTVILASKYSLQKLRIGQTGVLKWNTGGYEWVEDLP